MDNFQCTDCSWVGTEEERKPIMVPNPINPQDKTLYEDHACPECGCSFLTNLTEEEYTINWAKKINPNTL